MPVPPARAGDLATLKRTGIWRRTTRQNPPCTTCWTWQASGGITIRLGPSPDSAEGVLRSGIVDQASPAGTAKAGGTPSGLAYAAGE